MAGFEAWQGKLDETVDTLLSDTVAYAQGGGVFRDKSAFIDGSSDDQFDVDPINQRWSIQIRKELLEAEPSPRDRVRHPSLPGVCRPAVGTVTDDGTYYYFDLQKV